MRVPENWLRSFCSPDWSAGQIGDRLTMAGLEVEEATAAAPPFHGVVVAQVRSVAAHPNADKLSVCEVDVGDGALRRIVCGAPNVAAGMRVPCALPGAELPGGFAIKPVKMRGVESQGMLCSARELGLSEDHSGLMALAADAPLGRDLREHLALDETVYQLKLTPNLAHCMSVYGVARELAAISGAPLKEPSFAPVAMGHDQRVPVTISAPDLCGRFSGRVIRGVDPKAPTPDWIRQRLERAGQRSVSALVDLSNYVMLELGRPTHVFDLDKIHGGKLDVRWARDGETLKLLNGQTVTLSADVGVIADAREPESLAGIMGGDATAVSDDTRNVYVEAAFWWPAAVAGRSRRYNFATDAGARFERGVDPSTTVVHLEYLSRLIIEVCGGSAGPIEDCISRLPQRAPVRMRVARACKVSGVALTEAEIGEAFERLRLPAQRQDGEFVVTPPPYRFDLQIEEDLIEEVVRLRGYDRLPLRPPKAAAIMQASPENRRSVGQLKREVAARDYQETIHYSFVAGALDRRISGLEPIRLLNPIAAQMDVMRTNLWGGMIETLRANLNRKATRVRLFEIGRVFARDEALQAGPQQVRGIAQPRHLGLLAYGPVLDEQWGAPARRVDFFDVKGDLEALFGARLQFVAMPQAALHPGRSAQLRIGGRAVGWLGEMHPALQQELELAHPAVLAELELDVLLERDIPFYDELSKYPPVIRDLAIVVGTDTTVAIVLHEIARAMAEIPAAAVIKNVKLFDEYRGKGLENKEKSLAFRLWMQDTQRTLSDAEAAEAVEAVLARLTQAVAARLR